MNGLAYVKVDKAIDMLIRHQYQTLPISPGFPYAGGITGGSFHVCNSLYSRGVFRAVLLKGNIPSSSSSVEDEKRHILTATAIW